MLEDYCIIVQLVACTFVGGGLVLPVPALQLVARVWWSNR